MTIKSVDITHVLSKCKSATGLTRFSGAANVAAYDRVMVVFKVGSSVSATGTTAIRVGHSDTISGTYSGMTALSGITGIIASGSVSLFDFERKKKFAGFLLSSLSGTHFAGMFGYDAETQPSSVSQGFLSTDATPLNLLNRIS